MADDLKASLTKYGVQVLVQTTANLASEYLAQAFKSSPQKSAAGAIVEAAPALDGLLKVCIFRENQWRGGANTHPIYLDDFLLANLKTGESLIAWVRPGRHVFMSERGSVVEMNFNLGQDYYIETTPFWWDCEGIIKLAERDKWRKEITKLTPVPPKRIYSLGERVKLIA